MPETQFHTTASNDQLEAAILALLVLTGVMLFALLTRTPPHPPLEVAPFALAPLLGASLALGFAALRLVRHKRGPWLALAFAATALISYGPQKYFDPAMSRIWPAVLVAQAAVAMVAYLSIDRLRAGT